MTTALDDDITFSISDPWKPRARRPASPPPRGAALRWLAAGVVAAALAVGLSAAAASVASPPPRARALAVNAPPARARTVAPAAPPVIELDEVAPPPAPAPRPAPTVAERRRRSVARPLRADQSALFGARD
jgi:hypothetical protein